MREEGARVRTLKSRDSVWRQICCALDLCLSIDQTATSTSLILYSAVNTVVSGETAHDAVASSSRTPGYRGLSSPSWHLPLWPLPLAPRTSCSGRLSSNVGLDPLLSPHCIRHLQLMSAANGHLSPFTGCRLVVVVVSAPTRDSEFYHTVSIPETGNARLIDERKRRKRAGSRRGHFGRKFASVMFHDRQSFFITCHHPSFHHRHMTAYSTRDWGSNQYCTVSSVLPAVDSMEDKSASYGSYESVHAPTSFLLATLTAWKAERGSRSRGKERNFSISRMTRYVMWFVNPCKRREIVSHAPRSSAPCRRRTRNDPRSRKEDG
jgi:hypothetical protein